MAPPVRPKPLGHPRPPPCRGRGDGRAEAPAADRTSVGRRRAGAADPGRPGRASSRRADGAGAPHLRAAFLLRYRGHPGPRGGGDPVAPLVVSRPPARADARRGGRCLVIHLTMNQISAYIDGELPAASVELVRLHLSSCLECTERFGHVEEQEDALSRLLVNDPGEPFFAGFAERVLGPVPTPEERKARAEAAAPAHVEQAPPTHVAAPTHAVVPAHAPVPPRASAPIEEPAPRAAIAKTPAAETRTPARGRRPDKARIAILASALVLVTSAIGIVSLRGRTLDSPTASWIVEHLDPTSWFRGPSSRSPQQDVVDRRPEPASTDSSSSVPTVVDSGALDRAAARSAMAESVRSPEAYDDAADAWTDALPLLENDPEELASGRREVASARYVAWSLMPTPNRRNAALDAVRAYLLVAPPSPERDLAWKWLAHLKR